MNEEIQQLIRNLEANIKLFTRDIEILKAKIETTRIICTKIEALKIIN